jgi:hypothetical protein
MDIDDDKLGRLKGGKAYHNIHDAFIDIVLCAQSGSSLSS